jgi:hypothetical protein
MLKKLLLASVVGMIAVTAPVTAHADGVAYRGQCRFAAINDTSPGSLLGGQDVFNGQVNAVFVANNPTDHISGFCELIVNSVSQGDVLDATLPGTGFVAAAGRITYTAPEGSVVQLCDHVTTTSGGSEVHCGTAITIPVCPDQVCGDGAPLGKYGLVDQTVCPIFVSLAATVDSLPTAGVLFIDPVEGDVYLGGTTADDKFWDCPPYDA